jgi:hypothetical protein
MKLNYVFPEHMHDKSDRYNLLINMMENILRWKAENLRCVTGVKGYLFITPVFQS